MEKFNKLLKKLQPVKEPSEFVTDKYDNESMNEDIASYSKQLSPEDLEKIHYAESTGGKYLKNQKPGSSATGNYQIIDKTRKEAELEAKKQDLDENTDNPLRKDAILMKALVNKYENALKNAKSGPHEPNLENVYLLHKGGVTGGLDALKSPKDPKSIEKFKEVKTLLGRKPKNKEKEQKPAKNLLELLKDQ